LRARSHDKFHAGQIAGEELVVRIRDLSLHSTEYVTVGELAEYWSVSRRQIYKQIESGSLQAIRFGPRLYRIRTEVASAFERTMGVTIDGSDRASTTSGTRHLPDRVGVRPLRAPLSLNARHSK
jgi:excisionase family DNA binding protein